MNSEHYFVASEGLLGIRTNLNAFKWSYGIRVPETDRASYDACAVRCRVNVAPAMGPPQAASGKYHYFTGCRGADVIEYDRPFILGSRLRFRAEGLLGEEPTITFNRTYFRYVTHRFMNLHSAGYILTDLASLLLLQKAVTPLHCSCFRLGDATVVVAAPPNMGKTLTSVMACKEYGAQFLAEDLALTDGTFVFSVPWTSTFRYYKKIDRTVLSRARDLLTKAFAPMELLSWTPPQPITEYIASGQMVPRAKATHVVILERGEPNIHGLELPEAIRRIRNLNRYEFNYPKAPLLVAHEFFNPELDIAGACRSEESVIGKLAERAECLVASAIDPTEYAPLIVQALATMARADKGKAAA